MSRAIVRRIFSLVVLGFICSLVLPAVEMNLDNQQIVHMVRGDDNLFKDPGFDDSSWRVSALPFGKADLTWLGEDEQAIVWYRIHFLPPTLPTSGNLGLNLGKIADIDETWLNGTRIGSSGSFQDQSDHACNKARLYEMPISLLKPGADNVIAIRVKNTYRVDELPGRGHYAIGNFQEMLGVYYLSGIRELLFPAAYVLCAAYFLLLFIARTKQIENLWFSLFAFSFAIYSFCRTDIKYSIINNFIVLQKMEFISLYIFLPILMAFMLAYFRQKHHIINYIYYGLSLIFIVVILVLTNHLDWYRFNVTVVQFTWIVPLGTILFILIKNFPTRHEARIMMGAFLIILLGAGHDISLSRGTQIFEFINFWLTPFTMFLFVMSLATILSIRSATMMTEIEQLNATLEDKVKQRTAELNQSLEEIRIKDDKIEKEMVMAGKVQKSLLPRIPKTCPIKVAVRYKPLRQVSGDFYDYLPTPDGGHLILIADVSGHGMPAAIYTILAKRAFYKASRESSSPAEILGLVNDDLCMLDTGQYLTAFLVKFNNDSSLTFANGGHPRAIYLSRRQKVLKLLDTSGTCVGARDDASGLYRELTLPFYPGDTVVLYTDCLIERPNLDDDPYGEQRLVDSIKRNVQLDAEHLLEQTLKNWQAHVEGTENKDDLTLLALHLPEIKNS